MEKVKLPKEICKILDNAESYKFEDKFLWNAIQWDESIMPGNEKYKLNNFAYNKGTIKLVKAILHGYEQEETEEEKIERERKQNMIDFIKRNNNCYMQYKDYVEYLYDIAHGKE